MSVCVVVVLFVTIGLFHPLKFFTSLPEATPSDSSYDEYADPFIVQRLMLGSLIVNCPEEAQNVQVMTAVSLKIRH